MKVFFSEHIPNSGAELTASPISDGKTKSKNASSAPQEGEDPICEDALLRRLQGKEAMRRIHVIGNSHLAAYKLGWGDIERSIC